MTLLELLRKIQDDEECIEFGEHLLKKYPDRNPWLYGPEGDGMEMSPETWKEFNRVLVKTAAKFFRENM